MAAAEQVQVEMKDGLARASAVVEDRAVALQQIAFAGEFRGNQV